MRYYQGAVQRQQKDTKGFSLLNVIIIALLIIAYGWFSFRLGMAVGIRIRPIEINAPIEIVPDNNQIECIMIHRPCKMWFSWLNE